ncbi:hypothetical protein CVT25_010734 [Psilocybe cyanescens]|uniref:Uncharacterized protein n=1 Tax=Psilocybe cyanescens TaxID=93625 RepID=A0A409WJW3_PSICY|nr:hypothetical protein CVT25_010734 [Psilocybe cyanescens]
MNDGSPPISLFQDGLAIGVLTAALPFHIMQLNQWRNTTLLFVFLNRSYAFPSPASYLASMMAPYALLHRDCLLKALSLSNAYPFFRRAATSYRLLLRLELKCSFLRTPRDECILGIGVCLDAGARTLSFEFDWLIMEALDAFNIRPSFHKRRFDFFLPLTFDRSHFVRVPKSIWTRLGTIEEALREAENDISRKIERPSNKRLHSSLHPHETVEILYRMMKQYSTFSDQILRGRIARSSPENNRFFTLRKGRSYPTVIYFIFS